MSRNLAHSEMRTVNMDVLAAGSRLYDVIVGRGLDHALLLENIEVTTFKTRDSILTCENYCQFIKSLLMRAACCKYIRVDGEHLAVRQVPAQVASTADDDR